MAHLIRIRVSARCGGTRVVSGRGFVLFVINNNEPAAKTRLTESTGIGNLCSVRFILLVYE